MRVLVAIPYEPERNPVWPTLARRLASRLTAANDGIAFDLALVACPRVAQAKDGRFSANARARNTVIETSLRAAHDYVLWIDSDLIHYPADLVRQLLATNPGGISAPAVVLPRHVAHNRFYDLLGFVERGRATRMFPPWFEQAGPVVELDSVGCIYLAPASIYHAGARYADVPQYTEHMAVMWQAQAAGLRIVCDTRLVATHAWLKDYGEALH